MTDDAHLLAAAEVVNRAAQDFPALQVMGDGAVAEIDAVMDKQAMLAGNSQVISGCHLSSACLVIQSVVIPRKKPRRMRGGRDGSVMR